MNQPTHVKGRHPPLCGAQWAVFPNCLYPDLFRTSLGCGADEKAGSEGVGHWQPPGVIPLIHHVDSPWISHPTRTGRSLAVTEWSSLIWHFKPICIWYEIKWMQLTLLVFTVGSSSPAPRGWQVAQTGVGMMTSVWSPINTESFLLRATDWEPVIRANLWSGRTRSSFPSQDVWLSLSFGKSRVK